MCFAYPKHELTLLSKLKSLHRALQKVTLGDSEYMPRYYTESFHTIRCYVLPQGNNYMDSQTITSDIRDVYYQLKEKIEKDFLFFSGVGFFLGFLTNLFERIEQTGVKFSLKFASALVSEFISLKVSFFIFIACILIAALNNLLLSKGKNIAFLGALADHSTSRLQDLTSPILCFSLGFSISLLISFLFNLDFTALKIALLIPCVGLSANVLSVISICLQKRIVFLKEFIPSLSVFLGIIVCVIWYFIKTTKT